MKQRIKNGRVIDPANGVSEVRDVWIADGRIIDMATNVELIFLHRLILS